MQLADTVQDDCFYASVFEAENPALKDKPLAVQQKQIIVHPPTLYTALCRDLEKCVAGTDHGMNR